MPPGQTLNNKRSEDVVKTVARPLRSMTGFARVRRQTDWGDLTVSLRSVNHRALDFHFHQGSEFYPFESGARALLKQYIGRGHIEVRIGLSRPTSSQANLEYNRDVVGRYVAAIRSAAAEFQVAAEPDLNAAFRLPGAFAAEGNGAELDQRFEPELTAALQACVAEFNGFRDREGSEIRELLRAEATSIEDLSKKMLAIRADASLHLQKRLVERLEALLPAATLDPKRLVEEVAMLVDRSDVEEELARLAIHTNQLLELLSGGGEVGKKIDFLLQEMNRETNTILSKTSGIGDTGLRMTDLALAAKAHIEKIREQALNIE
jgi:uncharacterized protein (TIGR00255 family)